MSANTIATSQEWLVLAPVTAKGHGSAHSSRSSSVSSSSSVAGQVHRFLSNVENEHNGKLLHNDLRRNDIPDSQTFLRFLRRSE